MSGRDERLKGYTAREYIATLVMCVCLTTMVVTGVASAWILLMVGTIAVLGTHLRVTRIREIRRKELGS